MPAGILVNKSTVVKEIWQAKNIPIKNENLSINDLLDCFRVILDYIISEKCRERKVFSSAEPDNLMAFQSWILSFSAQRRI